MAKHLDFGLDTFGDVMADGEGRPLTQAQALRNVVEQGVLADEVGVDFFAVGEHHRDDYAISAPEVVLAAIAARTQRVRLGSAVTVLSSDDPIRVYQRFATVDAISNGRAEIILGRGSFTESFPLFGFNLDDYETLFTEKLDLFTHLLRENASAEGVNWTGNLRPPLVNQHVYPLPESGTMKTWIGVGGSPESVVRAATYGLPMMLAIIGGGASRFKPYAELYRKAFTQLGTPVQPLGVHSPGYIADTDEAAREEFFPAFKANRDRIGRERGWPPIGREEFEREVTVGSLYLGSPETVARKIARTVRALDLDHFDLKYSAGTLGHAQAMRAIELYGTRVIPRVREILAEEKAEA
ncbi:putative LLM family oxidoreductase [Angulomicrobium tetraedrale]|uniref:Putative LLM family oxidoreductase n=1 Tax=Ancylobacter tetraedralis TaxID=217068 RepID=A0A839ZET7_9HYPH|nr:LLM class flavin-dependent oxidoreductase [Ancylobacter tetraedralis]MBB3773279.1 putative LLM family oxidoreductase [Ancylobacter tetraedralis]